jgi:hypothetical protein
VRIVKFAAGMAIGYVLGSRAGRDKYLQIVAAARKAQDHPAVIQAQQKARQFLGGVTGTAKPATDPGPADTRPTAEFTPRGPSPARHSPTTAVGSSTGTVDPLT